MVIMDCRIELFKDVPIVTTATLFMNLFEINLLQNLHLSHCGSVNAQWSPSKWLFSYN